MDGAAGSVRGLAVELGDGVVGELGSAVLVDESGVVHALGLAADAGCGVDVGARVDELPDGEAAEAREVEERADGGGDVVGLVLLGPLGIGIFAIAEFSFYTNKGWEIGIFSRFP